MSLPNSSGSQQHVHYMSIISSQPCKLPWQVTCMSMISMQVAMASDLHAYNVLQVACVRINIQHDMLLYAGH